MIIIHLEYITNSPILDLTGIHSEPLGGLNMFMPITFGLFFALIGVVAWDNYRNSH